MTREDINRINSQYLNDCENTGEMEEIFDLAIKALDQEPFINKPCVSSGVCEHDKQKLLDELRAEIEELSHYYPMGHDYQIAITRCLAVIDKYKADSEP